ncbi:type III polyketide synthase [Mycetocola zhadangensis]|uniref:Type III polyketide synthase n=1 Tax=Mycetocola zhadangensis TaxID=1164595 RepID=A0A3L7JCU4_9MICO|nr:type III polyketide synthase [Mycetocola zhadangensis]RLQ86312.1 type III polyketide synthase [Mycetocola zhadangensis]GGE90096.1 naringenin-chalcone synthase [Mycetocola zhadangensis]
MPAHVRTIQTAVPPTILDQSVAREIFASQDGLTRLGERLVRTSFDVSGIDTRHTVVEELDGSTPVGEPTFYDAAAGALLAPSTRTRNEVYIEAARTLFVDAARRALDDCAEIEASDVTHVVTVSCTGFYSPGPDYEIVRKLGLATGTQRYHIGFMGCYGAFPALRAAAAFCEADPRAVVLIVSCEVCTIHVRSSNDPDQIVASSVFGDGAAAAIVTAAPGPAGTPTLRIDKLASELTPVGEEDMAWTIGDTGFEMVLSAAVPKIIDTYIRPALEPLLVDEPWLAEDLPNRIARWAIHPGGRSILDKVQSTLGLSVEQLTPSRRILRDYGNMSSATVLFVLKEILQSPGDVSEERVCAMAFGPGLTVETGLFTRVDR